MRRWWADLGFAIAGLTGLVLVGLPFALIRAIGREAFILSVLAWFGLIVALVIVFPAVNR